MGLSVLFDSLRLFDLKGAEDLDRSVVKHCDLTLWSGLWYRRSICGQVVPRS